MAATIPHKVGDSTRISTGTLCEEFATLETRPCRAGALRSQKHTAASSVLKNGQEGQRWEATPTAPAKSRTAELAAFVCHGPAIGSGVNPQAERGAAAFAGFHVVRLSRPQNSHVGGDSLLLVLRLWE
jgi:hypothetical protein